MEKKQDFLDGDHSFKKWFQIMWSNNYITLFIVALAFLGFMIMSLEGTQLWFCLLPITMMGVIGYKGFYQFWNDLKNGKSR